MGVHPEHALCFSSSLKSREGDEMYFNLQFKPKINLVRIWEPTVQVIDRIRTSDSKEECNIFTERAHISFAQMRSQEESSRKPHRDEVASPVCEENPRS
ncbi:hypothetical protein PVK06_034220 [Gossypium arboreum]|uniref:Uncharacterized protein n=1 Tax=Gossypium arboreum TaxID=29729 RepID=A0ABR0NFP7_GOSAR|nr:hypothetical protein PVK06_034220 [Gossypium arboreum]